MDRKLVFVVVFLALATLACVSSVPRRQLDLYPSPTILPTQTPYVVILTATTPPKSPTPDKKQVQISTQTVTPACFTVTASEAVYLRPSPSLDNYPITQLPHGAKLTDLGGRSDGWLYVAYGAYQGWVAGEWVEGC